jgi:glucose-6-phosphate 1-dehydrogenase
MSKPENQILVIFGASGDLTKRKLIPALYSMEVQKLLPEKFAIIGTGRTDLNDNQFRESMNEGLKLFSSEKDKNKIGRFLEKISYQNTDAMDASTYKSLSSKISEIRNQLNINGNTLFYLSTPPSLYDVIPQNLAQYHLNNEEDGWKRLIITFWIRS